MPNENAPVCACGVVVDLSSKSRNSSIVPRKLTILVPKSKGGKSSDGKAARKQQDEARAPKSRTSSETGSSSSVMEPRRPAIKNSKHEKRLNQSRRTRSADRAESHYTYIDSGSSILGDGIRESTIPEVLYATIPDTIPSVNEPGTGQLNSQCRSQQLYAIPSMTSPPPTYDVAIAKTRQTGLPPTYDEYLCHKSRSHTPPPPWSDSVSITSPSSLSSSSNSASSTQLRRELLADQPQLREYLAQLTFAQQQHQQQQQQQEQLVQLQQSRELSSLPSNQQILREQQVRARARAMPPRSQSVSRVQQQRIATMYEDAAFCMETTVLQSAFDQGFALCSLM
ncbi:uncharacterized protein LOC105192327 [Harpegnathos saltator]|uniref:Uncharacterized protein n=1 Tax=Harpegnathos saltator TaxID=610380 RepID=E2B8R4_HARSA|nr:uncharacterized protein LOC105192327 [Harpegnathos saltator]XP_011154683.1 uncharacterized protein LOC105192327 [Harpegnathos saltator]EFN87909.1 hypothetical protein EAI_15943 [Harpegnathos saltator]